VSWSRDRGRTWTAPDFLRRPDGRPLKNPRAANFAWPCGGGRWLYWFHNNGGPLILERHAVDASYPYNAPRNPIWMCGGVEVDAPEGRRIAWSEPEIVLYDDDPLIRMSYPDLVEEEGRFYVTETNKNLARVHELDNAQLEALWKQAAGGIVPAPEPVLECLAPAAGSTVQSPRLPLFVVRDNERVDYGGKDLRAGFSIELVFALEDLACPQVLLDSRDRFGWGLVVRTSPDSTIEISLYDGQNRACWDTDPGAVKAGMRHHLVAIVDGGPRVISFVLDGKLLDGGESRQLGWGRLSPRFANPNGSDRLTIGAGVRGSIGLVRAYDRALTTSEAVGRFRAASRQAAS
jgi:hypothetical protein